MYYIYGVDDGECEPVSTQVTGEFMGTSRGLWEGQEGFVYSEAKYSFHVSRLLMLTLSSWFCNNVALY